jgi:hypothetical protein
MNLRQLTRPSKLGVIAKYILGDPTADALPRIALSRPSFLAPDRCVQALCRSVGQSNRLHPP